MKTFYDIRYRAYNQNCKKPLCFFLASDIHFSPSITSETLGKIASAAKSKHPDYIIIPGDLIDYLDAIDSNHELLRLLSWLENLGEIAPTIIGLGNHDFYRINHNQKPKFFGRYPWKIENPAPIIGQINSLTNVHLLNNSTYEDNRVYIFGFTQSPDYYNLADSSDTNMAIKDRSIMLHDLREIPSKLLSNLPKNKVKIALIHSPFHLFDEEISAYFDNFDFTISGHSHNGAVPPILNDFWRSDRGISAPGNAKLFPEHARAGLYGNHIICGAATTISNSARKLKFLNAAFPINIATLELDKSPLHARKPDIHKKYESFNH